MFKHWEKIANEVIGKLKEVPEHVYDMFKEIEKNYPELLVKLGYIGDVNIKHEYLIAIHRFGSWAYFGKPIFKVTEDLFASLLLTNPKNISVEDVEFPYKTFVIRIPHGFWHLESFIDESRKKIDWIWVHEYKLENERFEETIWWRIDAVSEDGTCITYFNDKPKLELSKWMHGEKIIDSPLYRGMNPSEQGISFAMRRLVVNLCLYMSEVGDVKRKRSYKRNKSKKKQLLPTTFVVGSSIKISKQLIEASKSWTDAQKGNRDQWTIKKRFTVRGHWRRQACGQERKLRKRIWIAPHWKGPGKGEKLPRVYEVQ